MELGALALRLGDARVRGRGVPPRRLRGVGGEPTQTPGVEPPQRERGAAGARVGGGAVGAESIRGGALRLERLRRRQRRVRVALRDALREPPRRLRGVRARGALAEEPPPADARERGRVVAALGGAEVELERARRGSRHVQAVEGGVARGTQRRAGGVRGGVRGTRERGSGASSLAAGRGRLGAPRPRGRPRGRRVVGIVVIILRVPRRGGELVVRRPRHVPPQHVRLGHLTVHRRRRLRGGAPQTRLTRGHLLERRHRARPRARPGRSLINHAGRFPGPPPGGGGDVGAGRPRAGAGTRRARGPDSRGGARGRTRRDARRARVETAGFAPDQLEARRCSPGFSNQPAARVASRAPDARNGSSSRKVEIS